MQNFDLRQSKLACRQACKRLIIQPLMWLNGGNTPVSYY